MKEAMRTLSLMESLATWLEPRGIPYAIFGAQAARRYGVLRPTPDVDLLLGLQPSQRPILRAMLDDLGWHARWWRLTLLNPHRRRGRVPGVLARDPASGVKIDIILSFMPYDREALGRAVRHPLGRVPVRFASLNDVIVSKILGGRAQDVKDVLQIMKKRNDLDGAYIQTWLKRLGEELGAPLLERWERLGEIRRGDASGLPPRGREA